MKGLLGLEIAGRRAQTSAELAELLLEEAEIAVVPGEAFGTPGYFRLSCALGDADLEEGLTRMAKLVGQAADDRCTRQLHTHRPHTSAARWPGRSARCRRRTCTCT